MIQIYVWKPVAKRFRLISERAIREVESLSKLDQMFDEYPSSHAVIKAKTEAYWMTVRAMKI